MFLCGCGTIRSVSEEKCMRSICVFFLAAVFLVLSSSCEGKQEERVGCEGVTLAAEGSADALLFVRGSFNRWDLSTPMTYRNGRWEVSLFLPPGDYAYAFYAKKDGQWFLDASNPLARYENGKRYSRLMVPDCRYPRLELAEKRLAGSTSLAVKVRFVPGVGGADPDMAKSEVTLSGKPIVPAYDKKSRLFTVQMSALTPGKYTLLFRVRDTAGFAADPLFVPVWVENEPFDWRSAIIYQVMIDRFFNGDTTNDAPVAGVAEKANWQGGDFRGIIEKLDAGYFSDLGVSALWISSPLRNTQGAWKGMGGDPRLYTAYHSYWPVATGWSDLTPIPGLESPIEPHFGTEADLHDLVQKAHARGIRVIFDIVPNHVHEESWLWQTYRYDGWFNEAPAGLPANALGGYTCGWERPEECWFTDYLPDIDHRNPAAMDFLIAHYLWLIRTFDVDGFRIDAVRLMNLDFIRTLRWFVERDATAGGLPFFMVGETFTGDYGWDEIGFYLGSDKLDSQFDFPLFHHIARAFLTGTEGFDEFAAFLVEHDGRYQRDYHPGAVMATFLGNHDLCRALSSANDDFDGTSQGGAVAHERVWENEPATPVGPEPYERLRLAWTFLFTSPGIPTIYQGDEFGMPGANDPDNRRMILFGDDLNEHQKKTIEFVKKLAAVRRLHPALWKGTRTTILSEPDVWLYAMMGEHETVLVAFNRGTGPLIRTVPLSLPDGIYTDTLSGKTTILQNGLFELSLAPRAAAIYVR